MGGSPYKLAIKESGHSFNCSVFYHKRATMYMLTATHCPQIHWSIGQTIMYNGAAGLGSLCSDSTKHNEGKKYHHVCGVASELNPISSLNHKATI